MYQVNCYCFYTVNLQGFGWSGAGTELRKSAVCAPNGRHALTRVRRQVRSQSSSRVVRAAVMPRPVPRHVRVLRSRVCHRHAALPKIGLHQLAAGAVVLRQLGRIEHGRLQTFPRQRCLERRDMHVDIGIVRLERFIDAGGCIGHGRFAHGYTPIDLGRACHVFRLDPIVSENGPRQRIRRWIGAQHLILRKLAVGYSCGSGQVTKGMMSTPSPGKTVM